MSKYAFVSVGCSMSLSGNTLYKSCFGSLLHLICNFFMLKVRTPDYQHLLTWAKMLEAKSLRPCERDTATDSEFMSHNPLV